MARSRSSGAGYAVALVVMGFLFFIALIFAVIFYVQFNNTKEEIATAKSDLRKYVTSDEAKNPVIAALESKAAEPNGQTVVASLLDETRFLKEQVFGDPSTTLGDYKTKKDLLNQKKEDLGLQLALLSEIDTFKATTKAQERRRVELEKSLEEQRSQLVELTKSRDAIQKKFEDSTTSLKGQLGTSTKKFDEAVSDAQSALAKLGDELKDATTTYQGKSAKDDQTISELNERVVQLEAIINRIQNAQKNRLSTAKVTRSDGQIVSLDDNGKTVFLNRGMKDHVLLGMTFEVFDPDELIKLDDYGEVRGKATVEVFDVGDSTSHARIVRQTPRTYIKAGDNIVNLVYDPDRTFKFYVYGDFDVDKDGETSRQERQRIESIIRDWGGQVVDELNYDVDFLVLGVPPELPAPLPPDVVDLPTIELWKAKMKDYDDYTNLEGTAKKLSIPVLNQNRFFALVGLYDKR